VRAEAITTDAGVATRLAETVNAFVAVFRTMAQPPAATEGGTGTTGDADVRALIESVQVEQKENRAILTATVTQGFIRKALEDAPEPPPPAAETSNAAPTPPSSKQ